MGPHTMLWRREASPHFAGKESCGVSSITQPEGRSQEGTPSTLTQHSLLRQRLWFLADSWEAPPARHPPFTFSVNVRPTS